MSQISVVMPAFNSARYIVEALASVKAQTLRPIEVLVVDDGSTDATRSLAAEAGATVVTTGRNCGPASARNVGIAAARGDLIAFLDADDVWEPEHLSCCASLLERHPDAGLAFSLVGQFGGASRLQPTAMPENEAVDALELLWEANPIIQSAAVVRREALTAVGGYREGMRHAEDYDLWIRLALRYPFANTHRRLVRYRVHPAQESSRVDQMLRSAWKLRHELWLTAAPELSTEARARSLAALHRAYEIDLAAAWHQRSDAALRTMLDVHAMVPGSEEIYRRWRQRARLIRPFWRIGAWAFDRMPKLVRQSLRPSRTLSGGDGNGA